MRTDFEIHEAQKDHNFSQFSKNTIVVERARERWRGEEENERG
jgi:hypothetical protein